MITKTIHYCWFGNNPLPQLAKDCINSWKKYFPNYEIIEWNESNFDINCCDYVKEAYAAKKWAFVSDYARFWILYNFGGIYFDTDVEVIKPFTDIIKKGPFMGIEKIETPEFNVAPGLGLAASPGLDIYKKIISFYNSLHFTDECGNQNLTTVVVYTTKLLREYGLKNSNELQFVNGINIYPTDYFCPINCTTGKKTITNNTRSIHWYTDSWGSPNKAKAIGIERRFDRYGLCGHVVGRIITLPIRITNKLNQLGFKGTIQFAKKKLLRRMD